MYKFSLRFNSEIDDLGFDNGIPMNQLGDLITAIYSVVGARKEDRVFLASIKDNCYEVGAVTVNPNIESRFIESSRSIYEKSNPELNPKELRYKNALARVLRTGWYVEILDNTEKPTIKIPYGFNEKVIETYYSNKSIEGFITEIGDKDLNPTDLHIYISGNTDFKIFIDQEQHDQLKQYYREQKVRVKLKLKKSLQSDKILSAKLLSFKSKPNLRFPQNLDSMNFSNLKFIND